MMIFVCKKYSNEFSVDVKSYDGPIFKLNVLCKPTYVHCLPGLKYT